MDQRFRGLVDWLFESAETKSAHLMKKATLRGLFALGPTLIKMFIKINGSGWHQAWCGQVLHNPAHTAVSPLLLASVLSSMERSHGTDQQERFQPCGTLDRAGWPSVVSEQAHLGAAPHLSPKCKRSEWPNQFFPFPPAENHIIMAYPALEGPKGIIKHNWRHVLVQPSTCTHPRMLLLQVKRPGMSIPAHQNQPGHQNHVAQPGSHPHLLPASLRQESAGSLFFFFLFSLHNFVLVMTN